MRVFIIATPRTVCVVLCCLPLNLFYYHHQHVSFLPSSLPPFLPPSLPSFLLLLIEFGEPMQGVCRPYRAEGLCRRRRAAPPVVRATGGIFRFRVIFRKFRVRPADLIRRIGAPIAGFRQCGRRSGARQALFRAVLPETAQFKGILGQDLPNFGKFPSARAVVVDVSRTPHSNENKRQSLTKKERISKE